MIKYLIGMYEIFDEHKYNRDFMDYFYGVEACLLKNDSEVNKLINYSKNHNFKYGIHFPLLKDNNKIRDAFFLSLDEDVRKSTFNYIENQLNYIKSKGLCPEYILFHYPKPVILSKDFDLSDWRFYDDSEYVYEDEYSLNDLKEMSEELFIYLNNLSIKYNFMPILEFDALNKYVLKDDFLINLLERYPRIKLCLDTGRIHLQNMIDKDFDDIKLIKKYAKYTAEVHLWNVKINENTTNSHYPVLRNLKEEEGWAPIEKYLNIICSQNKDLIVMFEHRSNLISDKELKKCYSWIREIVGD